MAERLRDSGCDGVYHIRRLREGVDTGISPKEREASLEALLKAGLEIY